MIELEQKLTNEDIAMLKDIQCNDENPLSVITASILLAENENEMRQVPT